MVTKNSRKTQSIGLWQGIRYALKNGKGMQNTKKLEEARTLLGRANLLIGKMDVHHPLYFRRVAELNQGLVELHKGKWIASRAMGAMPASRSQANQDWKNAFACYEKARVMGKTLLERLTTGSQEPIPFTPPAFTQPGTEITYADGVPLIPEINPVVILQGSDFAMGYQYAQQLIEIFGPWIMQRKAGQKFTPEALRELHAWEQQVRTFAPEILEMCRGWAAGSKDAGVPMSYEDVLDLWTGHKPPAETYLGLEEGLPEVHPPACTGNAAWGRATRDGRLVTGSSGDHDCYFMVTIVAFPETGNNFIYTPFGATGELGKVGPIFMMGHPGINNKGLAYVHHGGAPKMVTDPSEWGYGLRLGTSVFHILRFANNAREAQAMELSFPAGDVGHISGVGSTTGFYADSTYGYVMESKCAPVLVREAGLLGETDFLYANNSAIHPEVGNAGWMKEVRQNWAWDPHGGWKPLNYKLDRSLKGGFTDFHLKLLGGIYQSSFPRNQFAFDALNRQVGKIDLEYMKMMYRWSGTLPEGSWDDLVKNYNNRGEWGTVSVGHASNALVVLTQPDCGDEGIYAVCVGEARRGMTPMYPTGFTTVIQATQAFWEIKLAGSPLAVMTSAREKAVEYYRQACSAYDPLDHRSPAATQLSQWLKQAEQELCSGDSLAQEKEGSERDIDAWARATRSYTRSQVRSQQVIQAILPPPCQPEDLL